MKTIQSIFIITELDEKESKKVQEYLFRKGYKWCDDTTDIVIGAQHIVVELGKLSFCHKNVLIAKYQGLVKDVFHSCDSLKKFIESKTPHLKT